MNSNSRDGIQYEVLQFSTRLCVILYERRNDVFWFCRFCSCPADQCGSVSGFWRCRVSRGQEGSGRGDTHSQISLEVTNCQLSLHAARVPGRRPVTVARACAARLAPICSVLHFRPLPILVACPGREHREPRRDGREHAAVASSVLGPRGLRVNGLGARRGQPQRRRGRT